MESAETTRIRHWAARHQMLFYAEPSARWFEQWEPFDTMVAPAVYRNAVVGKLGQGTVTIAEPWLADEGFEPLDRTFLTFVTNAGLNHQASIRIGEWFLTRVAFVGSAPPNKVELGDESWDRDVATFASTVEEARLAFHAKLRSLLHVWRFRGHLELRRGGLILHVGEVRPTADALDQLMQFLPQLLANTL